jgi:hypothetical protein
MNGACVIGATINSSGTACSATTGTVTASTFTTTTVTTVAIGGVPFCGSFEVGPASPGEYVIRVTGSDTVDNFVEAIFNVSSGPAIQLTPVEAEAGGTVTVYGTGFFSDTGCAINAPASDAILSGTQACVISPSGSGVVHGSFIVGPVHLGEYVIQVTGSPAGDFAQAILNVPSGQEGYGPSVNQVFTSSTTLGFEETGNIFDNSGAGYMIAHRSGSRAVFVFTDSTRVDSTGELKFAPDYGNAVVVAGPAANPTTAFYESHGFTPLTVSLSGGMAIFKQGSSTVLTVSLASLSSTNDYFVLEAFHDEGHTVLVLYGINAPGTLASGVYFDANFAGFNAANYPASAYIVHWQGTTPNTPLPGDTYTIVYHT